jgi:serine/threonine protein kinase
MKPPTPSSTSRRGTAVRWQNGQSVNGYTVVDEIDEGGFGRVYLAEKGGQQYAIKVPLRNRLELDAETVGRLKREAALGFTNENNHIIRAKEFWWWPDETSGVPVIVFDFFDGVSLDKYVVEQTPSLRRILVEQFKVLALALADLHSHKTTHRDIKPSNILVADNGFTALIDLGVARSEAAATMTSAQIIGTPSFIAPESVLYFLSESAASSHSPRPAYGPPHDLFALGVTLYLVLTGENPFQQLKGMKDLVAYSQAVMRFQVTPLTSFNASLPQTVSELILKTMAINDKERFQSGHEVAAAVDAVLAAFPEPHPVLDAPYIFLRDVKSAGAARTTAKLGPGPEKPSTRSIRQGSPKPPAESEAVELPSLSVDVGSFVKQHPVQQAAAQELPFSPPTGHQPAPAFVPPVQRKVDVSPSAHREEKLPTFIAKAQALLSPASRTSSARGWKLLALGAVGVASLLLLVSAFKGQDSKPHSVSLLERAGSEVQARPTAPTPISVPIPAVTSQVVDARAVEPQDAGNVVVPPSAAIGTATPVVPRRGNADSSAIEEELKRHYGGQRPVVSSTGGTPPSSAADSPAPAPALPAWLKTGASAPVAASKKTALGVPLGTELSAKLTKPLDSRLVSSGAAVAKLTRVFALNGSMVLPSGTLFFGVATANAAGRFDVRFTKARLPDNTTYDIEAVAQDPDKKPGLRAQKTTSGAPQGTPSAALQVVKQAADTQLQKAVGAEVGEVAKGLGNAALSQPASSSGFSGDVLQLEAPYDFVIFVSQPF